MSGTPGSATVPETVGTVTVHYWASARAAAGVASDQMSVTGSLTLAEVVAEAVSRHPGGRLSDVLGACSVLIGDLPVSGANRDLVRVEPGQVVEFLPPFAGG